MKRTLKRLLSVAALAALLVFCLTGCLESPNYDGIETLSLPAATVDELDETDFYPDLKYLDLTESSLSIDEISEWGAAHPWITITYNVSMGDLKFLNDTTELTLTDGSYDYDTLMETLPLLPYVTHINLPETTLSLAQIKGISETYELIKVDYTVSLLGKVYTPDVRELDLSAMEPSQIGETLRIMEKLPLVTRAELMDAEGGKKLSITDVKTLIDGRPRLSVHYVFDLFGKTVSTDDESIAYEDVSIGDAGETEIRQALDILQNCTYFKLDGCGVSNEVMAQIRDDYPDTKVVWRVYLDRFNMLTDEEMLRLTHRLVDSNISVLNYCTDVKYMDIGHNDKLTDISFVANMPKLECVIVSGAPVEDISYFENCPNLVWLELAFCQNVQDLSCLSGLTNLKYLNVSYSKVSAVSPLADLPLERFVAMNCPISANSQRSFQNAHPNCIALFYGKQPYGYGWRYNDNGITFFEYYAHMREVFRYDEKGYFGNHKE